VPDISLDHAPCRARHQPQRGFASSIGGNPVAEADERAKLKLCVDAARAIWGQA